MPNKAMNPTQTAILRFTGPTWNSVAMCVPKSVKSKNHGCAYSHSITKPPAQATAIPVKMMRLVVVDLNCRYSTRKMLNNTTGMRMARRFSARTWFSKVPVNV